MFFGVALRLVAAECALTVTLPGNDRLKKALMKEYEFISCPGTEVEVEPLARLFPASFRDVDGAAQPSKDFFVWYLYRPGLWAFSAWWQEQMVASVWATIEKMYLGGSLIKVGIIDGLCTHPAYRRQGLATSLLNEAAQFIKEKKSSLMLLYTLAPTSEMAHPPAYSLYQKLGYQEAARINYLVHPGAFCRTGASRSFDPGLKTGPLDEAEEARFIDFLNNHFEYRDGYVPTSRRLWRWRREMRPPSVPCDFYFYEKAGGILATICLSGLRVFLPQSGPMGGTNEARTTEATHLGEIVLLPRAKDEAFPLFLALIPRDTRAIALVDEKDEDYSRLFYRFGFRSLFQEVAMALPLTPEGEKALAQRSGPWYPLTESIIGV